jgi:crotonobetainyl-CoA:carnitine CoA-transferase CaiB-like acyl-CoA transferase
MRLSETPMADPVAGPALGQHTEAVLRELLHMEPGDIARLVDLGIVNRG